MAVDPVRPAIPAIRIAEGTPGGPGLSSVQAPYLIGVAGGGPAIPSRGAADDGNFVDAAQPQVPRPVQQGNHFFSDVPRGPVASRVTANHPPVVAPVSTEVSSFAAVSQMRSLFSQQPEVAMEPQLNTARTNARHNLGRLVTQSDQFAQLIGPGASVAAQPERATPWPTGPHSRWPMTGNLPSTIDPASTMAEVQAFRAQALAQRWQRRQGEPLPEPATAEVMETPPPTMVVWDGDEFTCSICTCDLAEGERVLRLVCRHVYHSECWDRAQHHVSLCPNCGAPADIIAVWRFIGPRSARSPSERSRGS